MNNPSFLHSPAFIVWLITVIMYGVLARQLWKWRRKAVNAKSAYLNTEARATALFNIVAEELPDVGALRGDVSIAMLKARLGALRLLHELVQATLDVRPSKGSYFDSIEAVKSAAAKLTELERCREYLNEANIGTAGLNLPSKAGVAERVSLICNTVRRMSAGLGAQAVGGNNLSPGFVWIPRGLERRAADMLCAFATELANKMHLSQENRRAANEDPHGWSKRDDLWPLPEAQEALLHHIAKGDPIDAALFCAFLWYHHEETSLMGYISMTPGLEAVAREVQAGVPVEAFQCLAPSKLSQHGTRGGLTSGPNIFHKSAKRFFLMAHELGRIDSRTLHELMAMIEAPAPESAGEDQPGEIPA